MTRILLIAGAVIAAMSISDMSFDASPAQAAESPWCAFIQVSEGAVYEDCQYHSFEACRSVVLAGNRGFCNHNPRWTGSVPAKRVSHKRRVHQD
jgi:uncharacterized protein DUF3551